MRRSARPPLPPPLLSQKRSAGSLPADGAVGKEGSMAGHTACMGNALPLPGKQHHRWQ